jgi:hypothetical protein
VQQRTGRLLIVAVAEVTRGGERRERQQGGDQGSGDQLSA